MQRFRQTPSTSLFASFLSSSQNRRCPVLILASTQLLSRCGGLSARSLSSFHSTATRRVTAVSQASLSHAPHLCSARRLHRHNLTNPPDVNSPPVYHSQRSADLHRGLTTAARGDAPFASSVRTIRRARQVKLRSSTPEFQSMSSSHARVPPGEAHARQGGGVAQTESTKAEGAASPQSKPTGAEGDTITKERRSCDFASGRGGGSAGNGAGQRHGGRGRLNSQRQAAPTAAPSQQPPPKGGHRTSMSSFPQPPRHQPQVAQRKGRKAPQTPQKPISVIHPIRGNRNMPGGNAVRMRGISPLLADTNAEERVVTMLRADLRCIRPDCEPVLPAMEEYKVPHTTLKRCVLWLSIFGVGKEVAAMGQSSKSKLARTLCYMHAEQLLDFYASGGAADALVEPPLPLAETSAVTNMTAPKEREFHAWDDYVDASERYAAETAAKVHVEVLEQLQIPASGHPVADRAAELLRRNRKLYCRPTALSELNESLHEGSHLIRVAHIASKVFVATLVLDLRSRLTATGVARNSKDARRECAAHALCILALLREDAEGCPQDSKRVLAVGGGRDAQRASMKEKRASEDDATQPGATLDAVLQQLKPTHSKLLRFFNLLFGDQELSPKTFFTREQSPNGSLLYHCELQLGDVTCTGTGVNRFEAQRSAMDDGVSELLLFEDRLQALQAFIDAHPSLAPESIPSASLPQNLVEQLRRQLRPVAQQQLEAGTAASADGVGGGKGDRILNQEERALLLLGERAFSADPRYSAQMRDALAALRRNPLYLTSFHPRRSTLAMATVREQVLDAITHHRITVVSGTTGCGKTTQVPQYILDHEIEQGRGGNCNILVTQPRRLSTFSVAERIASERLSSVGKDIGYAVRLDARPGRHITICTTGVLLQMFSNNPELEHVSHLIIDEVHDRDINCDVVLALVKTLLTRNPRLRVVLMSATMQSEVFARYFGNDTPVIEVEGAVHPVAVRYLEDIAAEASSSSFYSPTFDVLSNHHGDASQSSQKAWHQQQQQHAVAPRALMRKPPKTDYNLIAYLVHRAVQADLHNQTAGKSILVFLPGWKELVAAKSSIESYSGPFAIPASGVRFHIILLHSSVDSTKQRECFAPAPAGTVKVVLATNIAESGITIDDAAVVIDTGLIKTTTWAGRSGTAGSGGLSSSVSSSSSMFVPMDTLSAGGETINKAAGTTTPTASAMMPVFSTQLTLGYASRANGTQRKGRAGRTQGGVCYRLYTQGLWEALPAFPEADIHRVPLTQVLLKLLSLGYTQPRETMETFLEPPSSTNVAVSMRLLCDIGAVDASDRLTALGKYLAKLPCDPRIGKMIIMGAVMQCLDSVLTVAACTEVSPYVASREVTAAARRKRYLLARGSQSDHISYLNAYNAYCTNGESDTFAQLNFLHTGNLCIISKYKVQYRDILFHAGLISAQDMEGGQMSADHGCDGEGEVEDLLSEPSKNHPTISPSPHVPASTTAVAPAAAPPLLYDGNLCVDLSALSSQSFNVPLVKACVCAALFPNVAVLRLPPQKGSQQKRQRQAEKVDLRTKHFACIKPARDSACRRVGGPRESAVPNRTELLNALQPRATSSGGAEAASSTPPKVVPALFYVFQDVFGVREARQEFLTTLSSVSLWALLLFGASDAATRYHADLSLCVIDDWIAIHLDQATYELITNLRRALYACLHGKYHNPQDAQNNAALHTVRELCHAVLKAPVLPVVRTAIKSAKEGGVLSPVTVPSRLVDTGAIIDPLALARRGSAHGGAPGLPNEGAEDDGGSGVEDEEDDDEEEDDKVLF